MIVEFHQDDLTWDVVVIGAGPAGSVAAIKLADAGLRVLLAERKPFPRDKVCGGCLNARALTVLDDLGLGRIVFEASGMRVHRLSVRAGGRGVELATPVGMAICRSEFDERLAREASARGVTFVSGVTACVVPGTGGWRANPPSHEVRLEAAGQRANSVRARVVVLAGGLQSASHVAPHLLISQISSTSRIGAGTVLPATSDEFIAGTVYMSVANGGYAGAVCLADGRLIVAAALDRDFVRRSGTVSTAVQSLFAMNGWRNILSTGRPAFHGTPQLTRTLVRPAAERLFVIGDAAGYVEPFTGEGMASALIAAVAVAPYVMRGVKKWESNLAVEWAHEHRRLIQHRQRWCRAFAVLVRHPWLTRLAVAVSSRCPDLPRLIAQRVVGESVGQRSGGMEASHKSAALLR